MFSARPQGFQKPWGLHPSELELVVTPRLRVVMLRYSPLGRSAERWRRSPVGMGSGRFCRSSPAVVDGLHERGVVAEQDEAQVGVG